MDFLVTHKWVKPRRRGFVRMPSEIPRRLYTYDTAKRYYCVKCGAVWFTVPLSNGHYDNYFRAWGDIDRKVRSIPPCEGVIPERAPIGA